MDVVESVSYARTDGSWQRIEVGVDEGDLARQAAEWKLDPDQLKVNDRHAILALVAEQLVLRRMTVARQHDEVWFKGDRIEQGKQIQERARELLTRLRA